MKEADTKNYHLIADFLYEYHEAKLYITIDSDLNKKHDYEAMRKYNFAVGEYAIIDLEEDGIVIGKDQGMPNWDLEKMGIPEGLIINTPSKKMNLSNGLFSCIKGLFKGLKNHH